MALSILPELPKYLFKYITWEKDYHKNLIIENEFFFSSAEKFNDPFDSSVPLRYDLGTEEQILERYKAHTSQLHPQLTPSEVERVARNEMRINNIKDPQNVERLLQKNRQWIIEKYGIFSATSDNKNILMWSHYANSHKGICIRINIDLFLNFIKYDCAKRGILIVWDKIEYQTDYPLLLPFELSDIDFVLKTLLIKSHHWEYEKEYRFILLDKPNTIIKVPPGIIDQIILGCNISKRDKKELSEISKSKKIELLKAKIKRNSFGLNILKINV